MAVIYIDEEHGSDASGIQGTEAAPFKTLLQAFVEHGADVEYMVKKKDDEEGYKPAAKAGLKKTAKLAEAQRKKAAAAAERAEREAKDAAAREVVLEKAKDLKITEDASLPPAVSVGLDV